MFILNDNDYRRACVQLQLARNTVREISKVLTDYREYLEVLARDDQSLVASDEVIARAVEYNNERDGRRLAEAEHEYALFLDAQAAERTCEVHDRYHRLDADNDIPF